MLVFASIVELEVCGSGHASVSYYGKEAGNDTAVSGSVREWGLHVWALQNDFGLIPYHPAGSSTRQEAIKRAIEQVWLDYLRMRHES